MAWRRRRTGTWLPAALIWLLGGTRALGQVGDLDGNGSVDLTDFQALWVCLMGPVVPVDPGCASADLDGGGNCQSGDHHCDQ